MKRKYVILPARGLSASRAWTQPASSQSFLLSLPATPGQEGVGANDGITVLDSIHEDGAKLVEMSTTRARQLRATQPDIVIAPVVYYTTASIKRHEVRSTRPLSMHALAQSSSFQVRITDTETGNAVDGAVVVAFTDFQNKIGTSGQSNTHGIVDLDFRSQTTIERLYVYPPLAGYWGHYREDVSLESGDEVQLDPIDMTVLQDCVRHFYGAASHSMGAGVKVAVVDTGVGPHDDLPNASGDADNGDGHGTHVAGIIGGQGNPTGLAPGVGIRSYRVFAANGFAANFGIAKAIDQAVADGCDLINLSLKIDKTGDPSSFLIDPVVQYAMEDARNAGVLPIAAAGNDGRTAVDFPARDPLCLAVSAFGREGTFPQQSSEGGEILRPPSGHENEDFIAAFSNVGPEVDLVGPGVGVVSTVPGGYGVMSGTSMACPAIVGIAARLLSENRPVLDAGRDAKRSADIARMILGSLESLGFPPDYEGGGLPRV